MSISNSYTAPISCRFFPAGRSACVPPRSGRTRNLSRPLTSTHCWSERTRLLTRLASVNIYKPLHAIWLSMRGPKFDHLPLDHLIAVLDLCLSSKCTIAQMPNLLLGTRGVRGRLEPDWWRRLWLPLSTCGCRRTGGLALWKPRFSITCVGGSSRATLARCHFFSI